MGWWGGRNRSRDRGDEGLCRSWDKGGFGTIGEIFGTVGFGIGVREWRVIGGQRGGTGGVFGF